MHCFNCGYQVHPQANFCDNCGQDLRQSPPRRRHEHDGYAYDEPRQRQDYYEEDLRDYDYDYGDNYHDQREPVYESRRDRRVSRPSSSNPPRYHRAGRGARFIAYMIDGFIACFMFVYVIVLALSEGYEPENLPDDVVLQLYVSILVPLVYGLFKDGLPGGQSIGKKAMGLMVVDLNKDKPCSYGKSALRTMVEMALTMVPVIGFFIEPFFVFTEKDGRKIGDKAAGTMVIDARDFRR